MEIININDNNFEGETTIALGNFDGLHIGHQALLATIKKEARANNVKSSVLLFKNHTCTITNKDKNMVLLSDNEQKLSILQNLDIDIVFTIDFNKNIMTLSGEEFVKKILLDKINAKTVVVGFNYKFGYKASCDSNTLKKLGNKYGFKVIVVEPVYKDGQLISSTLIRKLILRGNILKANNFLGRHYSLKGKVIEGSKRGRKLGFPTANLEIDANLTIPSSGVYKTITVIDGKEYLSITNIGINPTYNEENMKIETHIIDFSKNIYNKEIEVKFLEYIRKDIKFNTEKKLIEQIVKDINFVKYS